MAFCTNCGKSLDQGARFCTNCGTPAQASSTPAPSVPPSAPAPVAAAPAPIAEPPGAAEQSVARDPEPLSDPAVLNAEPPALASYDDVPESSTSRTFVVICVVLLVLIIGGIVGTIYLHKQGKAKGAAQQTQAPATAAATVQTAAPEASSNTATPPSEQNSSATPGAAGTEPTPAPATATPAPQPVSAPAIAQSIRAMNLGNYPGATPVAIATLSGETVVAGFLTRDTPQQVMQYYKIRFPVSATTENDGKSDLTATLPDGARIRIHAEPQAGNTQVMVLQEN